MTRSEIDQLFPRTRRSQPGNCYRMDGPFSHLQCSHSSRVNHVPLFAYSINRRVYQHITKKESCTLMNLVDSQASAWLPPVPFITCFIHSQCSHLSRNIATQFHVSSAVSQISFLHIISSSTIVPNAIQFGPRPILSIK
jgi:hypothetical protein